MLNSRFTYLPLIHVLLIVEGKRDGKARALPFASRTDFSNSLSRPKPPGLRKKVRLSPSHLFFFFQFVIKFLLQECFSDIFVSDSLFFVQIFVILILKMWFFFVQWYGPSSVFSPEISASLLLSRTRYDSSSSTQGMDSTLNVPCELFSVFHLGFSNCRKFASAYSSFASIFPALASNWTPKPLYHSQHFRFHPPK